MISLPFLYSNVVLGNNLLRDSFLQLSFIYFYSLPKYPSNWLTKVVPVVPLIASVSFFYCSFEGLESGVILIVALLIVTFVLVTTGFWLPCWSCWVRLSKYLRIVNFYGINSHDNFISIVSKRQFGNISLHRSCHFKRIISNYCINCRPKLKVSYPLTVLLDPSYWVEKTA